MKKLILTLALFCMAATAHCEDVEKFDFVVAQDGSGDFTTVQQAIDAVPDYVKEYTTRILVKEGVYREKVIIPPSKQGVYLKGEDPATTTIVFDNYADRIGSTGRPMGTSGSATIYIHADNFTAEDISFENDAGPVGQAVAVIADGDRMLFVNCRFLGNQDTLYTFGPGKRQYYVDCYIAGTTDFIFGFSTAVFQNCTIRSRKNSYITAASTPEGQQYGYVFLGCRLTADEGIDKVYLGRPWRPYAKTVFIGCEMGAHILPAGWHNWSKPEREATSFYAEYGNTGPGAGTLQRVPWSHRLTAAEAAGYTPQNILKGNDNWQPL